MKIKVIPNFHLIRIPEIYRFFLLIKILYLPSDNDCKRLDGIRVKILVGFQLLLGNFKIFCWDNADTHHLKENLSRSIHIGSSIMGFIKFFTVEFFVKFL